MQRPLTQVEDIGWPRIYNENGHEIVMYQPQPNEWQDFKVIIVKAAIALLLKGEKEPSHGAIYIACTSDTDIENRKFRLSDFKISRVHFPNIPLEKAERLTNLVRQTSTGDKISLESLRYVVPEKDKSGGSGANF